MDITLHYEPTKKQLAFHETDVDEVLYGGAAGGGKSYAICWDALVRCLRYPKTHAYLFRRTYPELEQTLIQTMLSIVPRALGKYTASTHRMRLVNGSVLHFCHLSNEGKDMLTYQGAEIQWLYFDELTHFTKPMYDFIRSRVRAPDRMNIVPCVRCASNPGGPGHSWVKSYFVDATNIGETIITREVLLDGEDKPQKRTIQYIPATVRDNPHLPKSYEVELMLKPPKLRDALLYGKWDAFDGQAFPEFIDRSRALRRPAMDARHCAVFHSALVAAGGFLRPWLHEAVFLRRVGHRRGRAGLPVQGALWMQRGRTQHGRMPDPGRDCAGAGGVHGAGIPRGYSRQWHCRPGNLGQKPGHERGRTDSARVFRRDVHQGRQHAAGGQDADSQPAAV